MPQQARKCAREPASEPSATTGQYQNGKRTVAETIRNHAEGRFWAATLAVVVAVRQVRKITGGTRQKRPPAAAARCQWAKCRKTQETFPPEQARQAKKDTRRRYHGAHTKHRGRPRVTVSLEESAGLGLEPCREADPKAVAIQA